MTLPPTRRTLIGGLGAVGLVGPGGAVSHRVRPEVLAFYYGWYGTPRGSGAWRHWRGPEAPAADPRVDTPARGLYDSHDPATIARHAAWLRQAGVTGIVSSWWGQGTFEDRSLQLLLDPMHARGLKVAAYIEHQDRGRAGLIADLAYLIRRYADHPAWLRVDGRPVLFAYWGAIKTLPSAEWALAADAVAAQGLPRPVLIGDVNPTYGVFPQAKAAFDGLHSYVLAPYVTGKSPAEITAYTDLNYPKWKARVGDRIYCATVMPGFDDTQVPGRPPPRPLVRRAGTGTFDALWRAAIKTDPDWVLVTSFNEWHEGSEVEPSREYGDLFLHRNRRWSGLFLRRA